MANWCADTDGNSREFDDLQQQEHESDHTQDDFLEVRPPKPNVHEKAESAPLAEPKADLRAERNRRATLDLEAHSIEENIRILALPLIAERLLQSLVDAADMAMVGRVGAAAVTAVGLSNQLSMVATGFYDAIRVGTTAVVARRVGAGRFEDANQTLRQSLLMAAAVGLVAFLVISVFSRASLTFMGAAPDVIVQGVPYFWWKGLSLVFEYVTMTFAAALRGSGNTRLPMYVGTVVNILNLGGNYVLIGGNLGFPRLGAQGAGVATAFARFCGMVMIIVLTVRSSNPLRTFYTSSFRPDMDTLRSVLRVGLPASGERLVLRGAQILYTRAVAGLGTVAYAAHQIALRIESISLTIGFSFGAASTTLVGQYLGFGDITKAETSVKKSRNIASVAMAIAGLALFVGAPQVVKLFIPDDPDVIRLGSTALRIVAIAQPFMAVNHVLAGGLRGAGDTAWVMYITGASAWGVRVVLTYAFVSLLGLHLPGAWYAMVSDLIMRSVLFQLRFRAGHWKRITV
ncbi:MAG TPA: MATE family efflux transporter [Firmicutes bacterium]|nr:MATE family efflux transporter [Candidatus Fermentithermobacillaceae bacterium]